MGRLQDKVVIISGASAGLGWDDARIMAKEGAKVVIFARGAERVMEKSKILTEMGYDHLALVADATSTEDWKMVVEKTLEKYGRIDVLVNNAGNVSTRPTAEWNFTPMFNRETWDLVYENIFWAEINGIQACLPELLKTKGNIVNIGSVNAVRTELGVFPSAYSCGKRSLKWFTECLAARLGGEGVRVNIVTPGWMISELWQPDKAPETAERLEPYLKIKKWGDGEDIAYAVTFLASDEAKYITGQELIVDGGITL